MRAGKNPRGRVTDALSLLATAGIARAGEEDERQVIEVLNQERLAIAAGNLAFVEGADGMALTPSQWPERPSVPDHLLAVQDSLEASRQEGIPNQ